MAPEIELPVTYIKHKGFFDVNKIVGIIKGWFSSNRYTLHFPTQKFAGPISESEQEFKLYGERKMNDYVRFKILVEMRVFDYREVEVIREGKKIRANTGRIAINLSGSYTLDYKKRFHGNKIIQDLQDIYHKYVLKTTIEDIWEDELFIHIIEVGKLIREHFQHETA